jgi:cyclopropane-fatty-acyl-phospholipid synthase
MSLAVSAAERSAPDLFVRAGMRRAIIGRLREEELRSEIDRLAMIERWHAGPIALVPETANDQHYEVPARFFETVLGPRLKYSACLWPDGVADLAAAEEAMLALTVERAGLEDGMRILDLGCGWGSLSLFMAERFPHARIVAVSNSASQGEFIRAEAARRGTGYVEHQVADVNRLDLEGNFDAIVSIEMFEHVRNHPRLLKVVMDHLEPGGPLFVHVFAHRDHAWEFEDRGPGDWMARTFFSGGIMPSHTGFDRLVAPFELEQSWWIDGTHYQKTLEAWLAELDTNRDQARAALVEAYGPDTDRWLQRWRMFFMACAEFFGHAGGELLGVSHHRLRSG